MTNAGKMQEEYFQCPECGKVAKPRDGLCHTYVTWKRVLIIPITETIKDLAELDEIEERSNAAIGGDWAEPYQGKILCDYAAQHFAIFQILDRRDWKREDGYYSKQAVANGKFISHARTDIPRLIKTVRYLASLIDPASGHICMALSAKSFEEIDRQKNSIKKGSKK